MFITLLGSLNIVNITELLNTQTGVVMCGSLNLPQTETWLDQSLYRRVGNSSEYALLLVCIIVGILVDINWKPWEHNVL